MRISDLNKSVSKLNKVEKLYVGNLMGGIPVTEEEKNESLELIRNAISCNYYGEYIYLDIEHFSRGYPESIDLFRDYFTSYELCCDSAEMHEKFVNEKRLALLIISPILFENVSDDLRNHYVNVLGIAGTELGIVRKQFGMLNHEYEKYRKEGNEFSILDIVKQVEALVLFENKNKYEIFETLDIDENLLGQCVILSNNQDEIIERLVENSFGYNDTLTDLCEMIPYYLENGISYNDKNIKFTILDYYALTEKSPLEFINFFRKRISGEEGKKSMALVSPFANGNKNLGSYMDVDRILDMGLKYIINGEETVVDLELASHILNEFEEYHIPKRDYLVQLAARRYAAGLPMFPIMENRKEKSNDNKIYIKGD